MYSYAIYLLAYYKKDSRISIRSVMGLKQYKWFDVTYNKYLCSTFHACKKWIKNTVEKWNCNTARYCYNIDFRLHSK